MNTWGISGPDFLALYVGLFIASWILVLAVRRGIAAADGRSHVSRHRELGLYEAAMLNGGGRLALAAAACRMKEEGSIRFDPDDGSLVVPGPPPSNADPVEAWLYEEVKAAAPGPSYLLDERSAGPVLGPIRDRLQKQGLLLTARQTTAMRWQVAWFAPLLGLGAARVVAGTANHRPVFDLILLMLLTLGVAINLCRLPRRLVSTSPVARFIFLPRTTRAAADALRDGYGSSVRADGLARMVAISGGVGAIALADVALAGTLGIRSGSGGWGGPWSGAGGAGSCGGGGGGCGGGGGGGGGCGG